MFVPIKFLAGNVFDIDPVANIKYDKIYCGAGCSPDQVVFFKQLLDVNGQLLAPVTDASGSALMRYTRAAHASSPDFTSEKLMGVRFADLIPSSAAPSQAKLVLESSSNSRPLPNPHAPSSLPSQPSPSPSGFLRTLSSSSSSSSSAAAPEVFLSINVRSSGAIASRCVSFLQAHGIRAWLCTQDLAGGANFREEIVRAVGRLPLYLKAVFAFSQAMCVEAPTGCSGASVQRVRAARYDGVGAQRRV
jgi:hypothetical protein